MSEKQRGNVSENSDIVVKPERFLRGGGEGERERDADRDATIYLQSKERHFTNIVNISYISLIIINISIG